SRTSMRRKSTRTNIPTLASMAIIYKNRGFKRPKGCARVYMNGYNDAKLRYKKIIYSNKK
ncbi:MAG: hypothetical protein HVK26_00505, partial [Pelagibacteraceae bacterium]|nr:hypothetical protein [Pelagibacteraceae bacterium]